MNYAELREPNKVMAQFPGSYVVGAVAADGSKDNVEVDANWVSVLGNYADSASAHGVMGVRYAALEAWLMVRTTLTAAKTLSLLDLHWQQAPPDSSGDPDTAVEIVPVDDLEVQIIALGATPKTDHATVGVTTGARDAITVATGVLTNAVYLVRFYETLNRTAQLEFMRLQYTPDLSHTSADTMDIMQGYAAFGNVPPYDVIS